MIKTIKNNVKKHKNNQPMAESYARAGLYNAQLTFINVANSK